MAHRRPTRLNFWEQQAWEPWLHTVAVVKGGVNRERREFTGSAAGYETALRVFWDVNIDVSQEAQLGF